MEGDLTSLCQKPSFVFEQFDNFAACFNGLPNNQPFQHLVQACVSDYCKNPDSDVGGCQGLGVYQYPYEFTIQNDNDSYIFYSSPACRGINAQSNTDIGGPGVNQTFRHIRTFFGD